MPPASDQILTVAQMVAAEDALIARDCSVDALMRVAGQGAAQWVWRISGGRPVTVLCGPGNNGGDGYVIAESLRLRGSHVRVIAPVEPKTDAARNARAAYGGEVLAESGARGDVFVDALFGSGLSRPLSDEYRNLLGILASHHTHRVAIDLPSGVDADAAVPLARDLPRYDVTLALGAWKQAHWLMPSAAMMGERRLVPIGVGPVDGAAKLLTKPHLSAPTADAHKYSRGLAAVVGGAMPGAALLACGAAMHGGAGYVKLLAGSSGAIPASNVIPAQAGISRNRTRAIGGDPSLRWDDALGFAVPADLVVDNHPLSEALADPRISALLVGPGLGRDGAARECLRDMLARDRPTVLDADALVLLRPDMLEGRAAPLLATPHEGELEKLAQSFRIDAEDKRGRTVALAMASGMVIVAKGPDTLIAAPDGRLTIAPAATSWLSVAGTGDVLAGLAVSRLATDGDPFAAACEAVWLHGEAARQCGPAFTAGDVSRSIPEAFAALL